MPVVSLVSNITLESDKKNQLARKLTSLTAALTNKPEAVVLVSFQFDSNVMLGSDDGPVIFLDIQATHFVSDQLEQSLDKILAEVSTATDVSLERICVLGGLCKPLHWGKSGKTLHYWNDQ